ncbi:unnamed protein product [Somion occarium]|uniref:Cytochrome P450 n=1 Tax=Somion occarium TaxID=3059160 RepID=A0ABP1D6D0_9APHY
MSRCYGTLGMSREGTYISITPFVIQPVRTSPFPLYTVSVIIATMTLSLYSSLALIFLAWVFNRLRKLGSRGRGLPPGPPTIPLLGNLHIFPKTRAHEKFTEWARVYGDIYSLKMASGTAVVISNPRLLRECMDLHGGVTSDRPPVYAAKLIWEDKELAVARYGPMWKNMRRAAHDILSRDACMNHLPIQRAEVVKLMYDFLARPTQFYTHIYRYAASVVFSVVFGIHCPEFNDSFIQDFLIAIGIANRIMRPGGMPPIDILPVLKYIPERWAPWKTLCKQAHDMQHKLYSGSVQICIDRIKDDKRSDCFMEFLLDHQEQYSLDQEELVYFGGSLIQAGSYTTAVYLRFLVACIAAHPDVLKRAQAEMDVVVGADRMLGLDDLENLPYLKAVINEVHRFRPVTPAAVPHASTADVRVGEYVIPKGSMIFMNTWGICHNEEYFDNPDSFDPERFLRSEFGIKSGADPTGFRNDFAFGAGRMTVLSRLIARIQFDCTECHVYDLGFRLHSN